MSLLWPLSLSKRHLSFSMYGHFGRLSDRVKPQHPCDILIRGRHSRDLHNLPTELPALLHSAPKHVIRRRSGEEMAGADHRGAILSASPAESFADFFRSLDLQIQKSRSGLHRCRKFLIGFLPRSVAVIGHPAGRHQRRVRGREQVLDLLDVQRASVQPYLGHLNPWLAAFQQVHYLFQSSVLDCCADHKCVILDNLPRPRPEVP